jgi:hypothetical protein
MVRRSATILMAHELLRQGTSGWSLPKMPSEIEDARGL